MGGYELALRDIKLSLESGYPQEKAFKLYERKGEVQTSLKKKSDALNSFQMSIKMIKNNPGLKQAQKFIAAIEKKIEKLEEMEVHVDTENNEDSPLGWEDLLGRTSGLFFQSKTFTKILGLESWNESDSSKNRSESGQNLVIIFYSKSSHF